MLEKYKREFSCELCDEMPDEAFTIFADDPIKDWMIYYPEKRLIHAHYCNDSVSEEQNIREANAIVQFSLEALESANEPIFLVADFVVMDNSEMIPSESLALYEKVLHHPMCGAGIISGAPTFLRLLFSGWMKISPIQVIMTKGIKEANNKYAEWHQQNYG